MATTTHHIEHVDHIPAEDLITDPKRQRWILIAMIVSLVAVISSVSGLNVAQQDLALDLGASQSQLLWVINGYTIALAALITAARLRATRGSRQSSCSSTTAD